MEFTVGSHQNSVNKDLDILKKYYFAFIPTTNTPIHAAVGDVGLVKKIRFPFN